MKFFLIRVLFYIQIALFEISFFIFKLFKWKKKGVVVGVAENCSILYSIGQSISGAKTVVFKHDPYFDLTYDFDLSKIKYGYIFFAPLLLGYLAVKFKCFIYVGGDGFFIGGRNFEFKRIKSNDNHIVCYFIGSEIRSHKLMGDFSRKNEMDVATTYQPMSSKGIDSLANEKMRKQLAEAADQYASVIFNPNIDQMSYIKRDTHPPLYFADDTKIKFFPKKFENNIKKTIVHAPSSPIIKGTPIVRAAVKKLQEEGYSFEYVELIGVSNSKVLEELQRAHIVLNEFYAFVPGVFGIEAMMNNSVLLTSADKNIEPSLFEGANEAWVVTPYWKVYDNLKEQLDKPMEELQIQADKGTEWTKKYASYSFSSAYLQNVINSLDNND